MSSYLKKTKHPHTGEWHDAWWLDDYYGRHNYGVKFPNGDTFKADDYEWETQDPTPPMERNTQEWEKEFEERYDRFPGSAFWYDSVLAFIRTILSQAKQEARREVIELLERMQNVAEMIEMEGREYASGYEACRTSVLRSLENKSETNEPKQ